MTSLQRRLHLGLTTSLVVLMCLLWWVSSVSIERLAEDLVRSRLTHDADGILAGLHVRSDGRIAVAPQRIDAIYDRAFSGHYYVVLLPDGGTLRSRSLWDETLAVEPLPAGDSRIGRARGPEGEPLLLQAYGFRKQGADVTIAVAEDLSPLERSLSAFNWSFAGLTGLMLVALLVVQRVIVRRSLASLEAVRRDIVRLERGEVEQLGQEVPLEVQPMVAEVNRLLGLLGQRLGRSRNALGNLAHAIKGPLSVLAHAAEGEPLRELPELAEELRRHTETIRRLTDRELKRARIAGSGSPGHHFRAREELAGLADVLRRIYHDKPLDIRWDAPPDWHFPADRDDMLELLGNLLDNACKWCRATVRCTITAEAGMTIVVEDDGPGCSEAARRALTGRGVRVDESVAGHGLGLAIVRDIVELYHGRLSMDRSSLGGLLAEVSLPTPGHDLPPPGAERPDPG